MSEYTFNAPPGWDVPTGWRPPDGFVKPEAWPPAPDGWDWWIAAPQQLPPSAEVRSDPDVLWEAKGQPLKGFGGGKYKLTRYYLFFEKGALSTNAQQVPISALMDVDVTQTMSQKARKLGNIRVHIQRPTGIEIVNIEDIPNFREGQEIINRVAHEARLAVQRQQNTMHYTSQAMPPVLQQTAPVQAAAPTAPPIASATPDPMEQLKKLGELRDAGILTTEEFDGKKAEILGRM